MAPITLVAIIVPAEGKTETLRTHLKALSEKVHANEKGALRYEVTESAEGPSEFVVLEDYADESDVDTHNNTEYFKNLVKLLQEEQLLAKELVIKKLRKVSGFASR